MRAFNIIASAALFATGLAHGATMKIELLQGPDAHHLAKRMSSQAVAAPGNAFVFSQVQSQPYIAEAKSVDGAVELTPASLETGILFAANPISVARREFMVKASFKDFAGMSTKTTDCADEDDDSDAQDCHLQIDLPSTTQWNFAQRASFKNSNSVHFDRQLVGGGIQRLRLTLVD